MNSNVTLPSSKDAERYVLGALLVEKNVMEEVLTVIRSEDFYYSNHQVLMKAIEDVYRVRQSVDYVTVVDELKRTNKLEAAGGLDYIYDIVTEYPGAYHLDDNVNLVNEKSFERSLFDVVNKIRENIISGAFNHADLVVNSEKIFTDLMKRQSKSDFSRIDLLTDDILSIIEENQKLEGGIVGLDTGYPKLNEMTHGFKSGELIILAARPSVGKSTLALNIAEEMCKNKKNVAFFSLEMGHDQLIMRMLSTFSGVDLSKVIGGNLTNDEMAMVIRAKNDIDQLPLYIDQASTSTLRDIKMKCQKLYRENKLDCIIIDYLQLLSSGEKKSNRVDEVGTISRGLKEMARQFNVPVLALSQLSRNIEQRDKDNQVPRLSDLRESGSIEQDADIVMFLHREPNKQELDQTFRSAKTTVFIAKNRQGVTGEFDLIFKGNNSVFKTKQ